MGAWYAPGIRIAVTLKIRRLVFSCAAVWINPCSAKRVPPAKKHIPSTRSKLERMEPITMCKGARERVSSLDQGVTRFTACGGTGGRSE